jgi:hypothetical protein
VSHSFLIRNKNTNTQLSLDNKKNGLGGWKKRKKRRGKKRGTKKTPYGDGCATQDEESTDQQTLFQNFDYLKCTYLFSPRLREKTGRSLHGNAVEDGEKCDLCFIFLCTSLHGNAQHHTAHIHKHASLSVSLSVCPSLVFVP